MHGSACDDPPASSIDAAHSACSSLCVREAWWAQQLDRRADIKDSEWWGKQLTEEHLAELHEATHTTLGRGDTYWAASSAS